MASRPHGKCEPFSPSTLVSNYVLLFRDHNIIGMMLL